MKKTQLPCFKVSAFYRLEIQFGIATLELYCAIARNAEKLKVCHSVVLLYDLAVVPQRRYKIKQPTITETSFQFRADTTYEFPIALLHIQGSQRPKQIN